MGVSESPPNPIVGDSRASGVAEGGRRCSCTDASLKHNVFKFKLREYSHFARRSVSAIFMNSLSNCVHLQTGQHVHPFL